VWFILFRKLDDIACIDILTVAVIKRCQNASKNDSSGITTPHTWIVEHSVHNILIVIFCIFVFFLPNIKVITKEENAKVLLIQRGDEPYKGTWAFPGGFMNMDESTEQCAIRELEEETGLKVTDVYQIGAYSKVDRDPRGRTITVAYLAIIEKPISVIGQDDAAKAEWWPINSLPHLAFDHDEIVSDAITLYHKILKL
jgi:8-oxo-dGTP diphosphatase